MIPTQIIWFCSDLLLQVLVFVSNFFAHFPRELMQHYKMLISRRKLNHL